MNRSQTGVVRLGLIAILLMSGSSYGATTTLFGSLNGANEFPATGSPGTGFATVVYDSSAHTLNINVTFSGLNGTTTAAHIHCCAVPPANAGVATTVPTFVGFPLGVTAGTYSNTLDLTLASSWNPSFVTANGGTPASAEAALAAGFANGTTYLNIHTTMNPGGEIRSFLTPDAGDSAIPSLSPLGLGLVAALLALAGAFVLRK